MPYLRHRRDANHAAIIDALWQGKWCVLDISQGGQAGTPDLFIARGTRVVACEIKSAKGKLRPAQETFFKTWPGETAILRSVSDVIALG